MAKIAEVITHLLIRLLALRYEVKGRWFLNFNKEHGVLVKLDGKQRDDVNRVSGGPRDVVLRSDFEWALEAEKMVEESSVGAIMDIFISRFTLVC
jgi:hypothetical protein